MQYDGVIDTSRDPVWAERKHRQIIAEIEDAEAFWEIDQCLSSNDEMIDDFYLNYPDFAERISSAASSQKAILAHGGQNAGAPVPGLAIAQSPNSRSIKMFATNQTEGSKGPWMTWSSNGSAAKSFQPKTWIIRGKDENDQKFENMFDGFAQPCVFDLDTLKLGWEKDGAAGQAPERVYSSHYSVAMPRPDESKKSNGAYAWSNALCVRIATSQTQAVTWEQGSFGAYQGFTKLAKLIEQQWAEHSQNGKLLPVVQQTGVEERALSSGTANIPILSIVKWVERPAVLKDDAPSIAAAPPAPAPAAPVTPPPAPAETTAATAGGF